MVVSGDNRGFTLAEMLVVLLIVGLLSTLAVPMVSNAKRRAEEAALLENLQVMRQAIDGYYAVNLHYPETLTVLLDKRYLRSIPNDLDSTEQGAWGLEHDEQGGIRDVYSQAEGEGKNERLYREW